MSKIIYLPTRYYPAISGAEFYFQRMAELLTFKYKYRVDIFTSDGLDFKSLRDSNGKTLKNDEKYFHTVNKLTINRFHINYNEKLTDKIKTIKSIPAYIKLNLSDNSLKEYLKNGPYLDKLIELFLNSNNLKYDLIHTTFYPYFNIIISLILGKILNKVTVCTPFFHFSNPRYLNSELLTALRKFDKLIACTNREKKALISLLKIPESTIDVIPMGVDFKKYNIMLNKSESYNFKLKFFKPNEQNFKMVLFCGYKNYEKGAISILKAIPLIIEKDKKVYFVFIGPSTIAFNRELAKIRKIKNVRIINFTPDNLKGYYDKKKIAAFKEADIYLMPSRSDAFGISFLEAWALGKPVIGANIGATPEVIKNKVDGLLVGFDNPRDIANKVIYLLKNKKVRRTLGKEGKVKVAKEYTWEAIAKKTDELYQELILRREIK